MESTTIPKGFTWSQKKAEAALARHQYIKIGPKTGHLTLSGAVRRWTKEYPDGQGRLHANDLYYPGMRIVGSPQDLTRFLAAMNYDQNQINQILVSSYSLANHNTEPFKSQFEQEIAADKQYKLLQKEKKASTKKLATYTLADLDRLVAGIIQGAPPVKRSAGQGTPGRGGARTRDIRSRLEAAMNHINKDSGKAEPKVLDVSKFDPLTGKGIKSIKMPGEHSKKIGITGLAIISSDPTNYASVVRSLGLPNGEDFINAYNEIYQSRQSAKTLGPMKPAPSQMAQPIFQQPVFVQQPPSFQQPITIPVGQGLVPFGSPRTPTSRSPLRQSTIPSLPTVQGFPQVGGLPTIPRFGGM